MAGCAGGAVLFASPSLTAVPHFFLAVPLRIGAFPSAMVIGGFQVQPTLRPEDVLVAGTLPGWWW